MKTVDIGKIGEKEATRYLKKKGYTVLEANIHISHNEIDIIVRDKEFIVFVEVKTRSTNGDMYSAFGTPASAVTYGKKQRTVSAARNYLQSGKYDSLQPRFDVIEVYLDKSHKKVLNINHIINAFGA